MSGTRGGGPHPAGEQFCELRGEIGHPYRAETWAAKNEPRRDTGAERHSPQTPSKAYGAFLFRNTKLEELHDRISDEEMKALNIDCANHCYALLSILFSTQGGNDLIDMLKQHDQVPQWDEPEIPAELIQAAKQLRCHRNRLPRHTGDRSHDAVHRFIRDVPEYVDAVAEKKFVHAKLRNKIRRRVAPAGRWQKRANAAAPPGLRSRSSVPNSEHRTADRPARSDERPWRQ